MLFVLTLMEQGLIWEYMVDHLVIGTMLDARCQMPDARYKITDKRGNLKCKNLKVIEI